ncbi:CHASE2 domain-containing protein [Calothrix anomala FACHB-343]|uniref:CHASE2 domain-containing protein n=1 Tax=Calothrix anomala FACHB-343 TaxID=2692894 RepID=A0ABR8B913_9CYAN|nr:CHASE2 domain-containing protein [Calothrix anomala FACHB-343]
MQISDDDRESLAMKLRGSLPPEPKLPELYKRWRILYDALQHRSNGNTRLDIETDDITCVSEREFSDLCQQFQETFNSWMKAWIKSGSFLDIDEQLRTKLNLHEEIRILIETDDPGLRTLPWHSWAFLEDYDRAEVAFIPQFWKHPKFASMPLSRQIRILGILGASDGIDTQKDWELIKKIDGVHLWTLPKEPKPEDLNNILWDKKWDILFFAGHSSSEANHLTGHININEKDKLTIAQLKHALKVAINNGLKLAIFNSCDGLGLAHELAELNIPQIIVMRESIPDEVAHNFLQYFFKGFSQRKSCYLAVREARERLKGMESRFPCASWLPVIFQNPVVSPLKWEQLRKDSTVEFIVTNFRRSFPALVIGSMATLALVMGVRQFGFLESWELKAFDQLMRLRPKTEGPDPRLLIIENTETEIEAQKDGRGSLSNGTLNQLLDKLEQYQPALIGLDIYRWMPIEPQYKALSKHYQQNHSFITICFGGDKDQASIKPPPDLLKDKDLFWQRVGFNDTPVDADGRIRRNLLSQSPPSGSNCESKYSFNFLLAYRYLNLKPKAVPIDLNDNSKHVQIGDFIHKILESSAGGYSQIDARGFQLLLNYRATDSIAKKLTISQVINGKLNPDLFKDKIVLIGTTAHSYNDFHLTPYSENAYQKMSGVEVQAHMLSQLLSAALDKRPLLWYLPDFGEIIWAGIWAFVGGIISLSFRSKIVILFASGIAVIVLYGSCYLLLLQGGWMPLVPSVITLITGGIVVFIAANLLVKNQY